MTALRDIIEKAVAEASFQWNPLPSGTFDSVSAMALVDRTVARLIAFGLVPDSLIDIPSQPIAEPPEVTARRELEKSEARERCAVALDGHLFYAGRASCARCFEPRPAGYLL